LTLPTDLGGFKKCLLSGRDRVYSRLKYGIRGSPRSRVPETESSGRIHTSTATVAVLPEVDEVEIEINEEDLEIKTLSEQVDMVAKTCRKTKPPSE